MLKKFCSWAKVATAVSLNKFDFRGEMSQDGKGWLHRAQLTLFLGLFYLKLFQNIQFKEWRAKILNDDQKRAKCELVKDAKTEFSERMTDNKTKQVQPAVGFGDVPLHC